MPSPARLHPAGGIGHAICEKFLSRGCDVIATARRVERIMRGLEAAGAALVQLDTAQQASVEAAAAQVGVDAHACLCWAMRPSAACARWCRFVGMLNIRPCTAMRVEQQCTCIPAAFAPSELPNKTLCSAGYTAKTTRIAAARFAHWGCKAGAEAEHCFPADWAARPVAVLLPRACACACSTVEGLVCSLPAPSHG